MKRKPSGLLRFEHRAERILPLSAFWRRVFHHALAAFTLIGGSLAVGVIGYHMAGGFGWLDSLYNASMILGGMGPVIADIKDTPSALKWFASFYALYSGLALLTSAGVLLAPAAHRILHRLHLDDTAGSE
jgi:hypothetical protein